MRIWIDLKTSCLLSLLVPFLMGLGLGDSLLVTLFLFSLALFFSVINAFLFFFLFLFIFFLLFCWCFFLASSSFLNIFFLHIKKKKKFERQGKILVGAVEDSKIEERKNQDSYLGEDETEA